MYEIIMDIGAEEPEIANFPTEEAAQKYWDRIIANAADLGLKSARFTQFDYPTGVSLEEARKAAVTLHSWPAD
jgi:hypothetical protein